jgi:3'(2'), 5'-bisphosphate nucleotidase
VPATEALADRYLAASRYRLTTLTLNDHELAHNVAEAAGERLLAIRTDLERGVPVDEVRARGDRESNELIVELLAAAAPDDAVLSEESIDDPARLRSDRVWIVDPLDGTREFGELERSDWAVHVALVIGGDLALGAVALPAKSAVHSTFRAPQPAVVSGGPPRLAVSRTRPANEAQLLAAALSAEIVPLGSAGAKTMAVVDGIADAYVHSGGQYEWDSAAPVAVAAAAGMHVSRIDGSPLRYNQPSPWLPDLLVCRPEFADTIVRLLASAA